MTSVIRYFIFGFLSIIILAIACKSIPSYRTQINNDTYLSKKIERYQPNLLAHLSHEMLNADKYYHLVDGRSGDLLDLSDSASGDDLDDGCFKLINAHQSYEVYKDDNWDRINLLEENAIPIKASTTYTLSIMMKTPSVCPSPALEMRVDYFKKNGDRIYLKDRNGEVRKYNGYPLKNIETIRAINSKADTWQEQHLIFKTPVDAGKIVFSFTNNLEYEKGDLPYLCDDCDCASNNADCWPILIDDFYLGEGISFKGESIKKQSFKNADSNVHIDEYGNVEILDDGIWKAFFPLMIYQTHQRDQAKYPSNPHHSVLYLGEPDDPTDDGYRLYGQMGFNTSAWSRTVADIEALLEGGLDFVNFDITSYCKEWDKKGSYTVDKLITDINAVRDAGLEDRILFYYHDNELSLHQVEWHELLRTLRSITSKPIYQLNGYPGNTANYYNEECQLIDVSGTYVTDKEGFHNRRFSILDHQSNMGVPAIIAQHTQISPNPKSGGHDMHPRPIVYAAIANGARGYGYFMDVPIRDLDGDGNVTEYDRSGDIRFASWKADFPNIACEVNNMLPIIRMPHWTPWKVQSSNDKVDLGTREYKGYPYLFIANSSGDIQTVELDLKDLGILHSEVVDYNSGEKLTSIVNCKLKITLAKDEGRLLKILNPIPLAMRLPTKALPKDIANYEPCDTDKIPN